LDKYVTHGTLDINWDDKVRVLDLSELGMHKGLIKVKNKRLSTLIALRLGSKHSEILLGILAPIITLRFHLTSLSFGPVFRRVLLIHNWYLVDLVLRHLSDHGL
jgi:hypothetical protein